MSNEYELLSYANIINSVKMLTEESSKIKATLVRRIIMSKELNRKDVQLFESFMNNHLRFWTEHAESLKEALSGVKKIDNTENLQAMDYDYIKPFIYSNYDYASVLQFTDGIFEGIDDEKFKKIEDLEDFKDFTISKAFDDNEGNVGALLDSVTSTRTESLETIPVGKLELDKFYAVKSYDKLFKSTDTREIYKSISKVIEYLLNNDFIEEKLNMKSSRLYIGAISYIIDYITYTLAAYACRIFIISRYFYPFIQRSGYTPHKNNESVHTESTNITIYDVTEHREGVISNIFHSIDETVIKNNNKIKEYFDKFAECLKFLEVDQLMTDGQFPTYSNPYCASTYNSGKIPELVNQNILYKNILNINGIYSSFVNDTEINELYQVFKYDTNNKNFGLEGIITPRNELLTILSDTTYGDSLNDYKKLARDLYCISLLFSKKIVETIQQLESYETDPNIIKRTISMNKTLISLKKLLTDLYVEIMFAIGQKIGFIERKISELRDSEIKRKEDIFTLDIKGLKSDTSETHRTMLSVPDTTPKFDNNIDLYSLPAFENAALYMEYLRSIPMFENDMYLSEAGIGSIIDAIVAALKSMWAKVTKALQSTKYKAAQQWVVTNKNTLLRMTFPQTVDMDVLPYKNNITLPDGFQNFVSNLSQIKQDDLLKNADELKKNLYPPKAAEWFNTKPETAPQRYMNSILFDDGSELPVKLIKVTQGAKLAEYIKQWVSNIESSDKVITDFNNINNKINTTINNIKTYVTNLEKEKTNAANKAGGAEGATPPPSSATPQKESVLLEADAAPGSTPTPGTSTQSTTANANKNPDPENSTSFTASVNVINEAISRLWTPIGEIVVQALFKQYGYIKTAYSYGIKK